MRLNKKYLASGFIVGLIFLIIVFVIAFPTKTVTINTVMVVSNYSGIINMTQLAGFSATANSVYDYPLTITNNGAYNITLSKIQLPNNHNFSLFNITPQLPQTIKPGKAKNFTLGIRVPNHNYTGTLTLVEVENANHPLYLYSTHAEAALPQNREFVIYASIPTLSNLSILTQSQYNNFNNSKPFEAIYSKQIESSGFLNISNLTAGTYEILLQSNSSNATFDWYVAPKAESRLAQLKSAMNFTTNFSIKNYSIVNISAISTAPIKLYVSSRGYDQKRSIFNISQQNISYGSRQWWNRLYLNKGNYTIYIDSTKRGEAFLSINNMSALVSPFYYIYQNKSTGALPVGIASYGLYDTLNNSMKTYQINTSKIVGMANISAIKAYNAAPPQNVSKSGASLQLNAVLNFYKNDKRFVYWLQDVAEFNTSNNNFYLSDNIWNFTLPKANMSRFLLANGNYSVYTFNETYKRVLYVYPYPKYYMNYSLPLSIKLIIQTKTTYNGAIVSFGYQIIRNDYCIRYPFSYSCTYYNYNSKQPIFYDNVTIPNANNSTILVTPYYTTPTNTIGFGNYYDAELVFGGSSIGENTTFTSANAKLNLYYNNNGVLIPFPSTYTFGRDTGEGAYNLNVSVSNQTGYVSIGKINPLANINTTYSLHYLQNSRTLP